jgi:hypothetical protein
MWCAVTDEALMSETETTVSGESGETGDTNWAGKMLPVLDPVADEMWFI